MGRFSLLAAAAFCVVLAAACKDKSDGDEATGDDEDVGLAEDGSDSNATENDTQIVASSLISSTAANDLKLASFDATDIGTRDIIGRGAGTRALYLPHTCVTVSASTAVDGDAGTTSKVTYAFDDCLGPNGLRHVTGTIDVTSSTEPGKLHLQITASGFHVNQATLDWNATGDLTADGAMRTLVWDAQLQGTTGRGRAFSRAGHQTMGWTVGEECFTLSGESDGKVRDRELRTKVEDFRRCRGGCPSGTVTITRVLQNKTLVMDYDGTATATFTGPKGRVFKVPLLCTP